MENSYVWKGDIMRISTKVGIMMLGIILFNGLLMVFTILSLNNISDQTNKHQNKNTPSMITSLSLQKDIIQIQQWLTDVSATRGEHGLDDGFDKAEEYYESAKDKIEVLRGLGIERRTMDSISENLNEYYKIGIDMANAYINNGTDAGNIYMEKFDPYAVRMEESIKVLLEESTVNFNDGNVKIAESIAELYKRSIILFSIIILISIISFFIIRNVILKRLAMMSLILKEISEGDGDLTKRADIKSSDEIGTMETYFNNFIGTVHNIVFSVKELSGKVAASSEELEDISQQSAVTAEEISHTIDEIARSSASQSISTTEGSEKLMELGSFIEEDKQHVKALTEVSDKVNKLIKQGLDVIDKLIVKTNESNSAINSVNNTIMKTNESSEKISEASVIISSIAEQTNLLALNASIEAARAGEHGKGFAVVAEEIRKLAEQSARSAMTIGDMVKNLMQDAANAGKTMEEVEKILHEQFENVNLSERKYKEIAKTLERSREVVLTINKSGIQMEQKKREVLDAIQVLSTIAEENASGTEQASASIQEQTASIEEIANASKNLSGLFRELQGLIERFKV